MFCTRSHYYTKDHFYTKTVLHTLKLLLSLLTLTLGRYFFLQLLFFNSFLLSLLPLNPGHFFLFYSQCIHLCLLTSFLFIISWKMSSCMFDPLCKSFFVHIWSVLIKLTFSVNYSSKIFNHNSTGQCHFCTKTFLCEWSLLHALALFYGVSIARV